MITNKKMLIILVLFLITITGVRLTWLSFQKTINHPQAVNGILDLRGWKIPQNHTIILNGDWEFFPYKIIMPSTDSMNTISSIPGANYIHVPDSWEDSFAGDRASSFRFGTYRLQILIDEDNHQTFKLRINEIMNASAIYVNGQLSAGAGHPSVQQEQHRARNIPYSLTLPVGSKIFEIIIQASSNTAEGGITESIRFGTTEAMNHQILLSMGLQIMLCIILLVHGLYAVMFYFLGTANKGMLYFALLILCAIVSVLVADDKLLFVWFPLPNEASAKITLLSYIGVSFFLPALLKNMFSEYRNSKLSQWFTGYCIVYAVFVLFTPFQYTISSMKILLTAALLTSVIVSVNILQFAIRKQEDVIYLLLGCSSLGVNIIWAFFQNSNSNEMMHYPFDLIITVFAFAAFWFKRFFRINAQTKQLAESLQLANQQKDVFLVNTSHELRNPLHGIINISQNIMDDAISSISEEHRRKLEIQISVAKRMSLMLDDLIDVTQLKENTIRLQINNISVHAVATGIFEMLRFMLNGKPISLHIDLARDFPAVKADENRLIQIMFNLLHNAIKFTDEGEIAIHAAIVGKMAHIHIKDTGIGMDKEMQQRIFMPYEQGDSNIVRASGGFGLGLTICKQLVELHGGTITVNSSPGQGSVFTFTLPLSDEADHSKQTGFTNSDHSIDAVPNMLDLIPLPASAEAVNKPKVLIVDDDLINLKILADILGTVRYDITVATNAAAAIVELEAGHFDLMISDVMMPHISGYELTRFIRQRFSISELPVLLLTARNRSEDISAGFQSGANDYVTKPVDSWELRSRVHALTELKLSIDERMRMEAAWLQAQIQPHFLYNTLNSIAALGAMDIAKMQLLLEELSTYLRTSFDFHNSDRVVSLDRELTLVRSYLYIEKERFGERLKVQWDLDENLNLHLPPLSIQTLVENALNHGILRRSRGGTIIIQIMDSADYAEISICDNGVGISEEKLKQILDEPSGSSSSDGIGLRNTDRRLKQLYGKGLQIQSISDQGTTVTFHIPK
mgnify:CR=1 FL=1|jgi:Signal transduction histidine kinase